MKDVSNFRIALYHSANVFFISLIIKSWLIEPLMKALFGTEKLLEILLSPSWTLIMFVVSILAIFIGVLFSRWDLHRRQYIIKDKKEIARLSLFVFAGISLCWNGISFFIVSRAIAIEINIVSAVFDIVILSLIVYIATLKFIRTTAILPDKNVQ